MENFSPYLTDYTTGLSLAMLPFNNSLHLKKKSFIKKKIYPGMVKDTQDYLEPIVWPGHSML